jgi:hypothetical protein
LDTAGVVSKLGGWQMDSNLKACNDIVYALSGPTPGG